MQVRFHFGPTATPRRHLEYDELLEITPTSLRLRKMYLTDNERKSNKRSLAVKK
ncbi:MAG: hypothetical protein JKY61_09980 [Planctomycetes bacterium]|nr:hypothetical protein [Planctomycetota bacterium]